MAAQRKGEFKKCFLFLFLKVLLCSVFFISVVDMEVRENEREGGGDKK